MNKLLGGTLAVIVLAACSGQSNPQTVTLAGGSVLYLYDSLAHGGADLQAATLSDSLAHGGGDMKVIVLTAPTASSTPSNGNKPANASCRLNVIHDTSATGPTVIRIEASC